MAYVITEACIDEVSQECVGVCPVDAIYEISKVPAHLQEHVQLDRMWYSDPEAVRARINELKPA